MKYDPLKPNVNLLVKLGSIAIHVEEGLSTKGHPFDLMVLQGLMNDPEVDTWMKAMDKMAYLPKKR